MIKLKLIKSSGDCSALHLPVAVAVVPLHFKNCSCRGSAAAFFRHVGVAVAPLHFKVALPSSAVKKPNRDAYNAGSYRPTFLACLLKL